MIDALTRYTSSAFVKSKQAEVIVDTIFKHWISLFGTPGKFLSDNGGEFGNETFREMGEGFNIRVVTTGAESPWANGIVEKYNGTLAEISNL